jgi:hypothetical protein
VNHKRFISIKLSPDRHSGVALDLNFPKISGARRLRGERKRGLQRFEIGCVARLPTARAGIVPFMRRGDLEIEQADRGRCKTERRHRGKRVDCMIPQKATRTDLFIWSNAAIVSVFGVAAICMMNASLSTAWRNCAPLANGWVRGREAPIGPQALAIISQLEQFQTRRFVHGELQDPVRATERRSVVGW